MQKIISSILLMLLFNNSYSQSRFSKNELSINGFRNPSIGVEYRHQHISVHVGYYITALEAGITTKFLKTGVKAWFLPVGKKENPSSFFVGASYLRGIYLDYNEQNVLGVEAGFRWMIWKGLNFRIGAIALAAKEQNLKINPTPGISYSFLFK